MKFRFSIFLIFTFIINFDLFSQEQEDDDIDFGVPGDIVEEVDNSCNLSDDARLL